MTDEAPALREFGYESLTENGRPAGGSRPLIVVLVEYDVDNSGRFGTFADAHPVEYYERLAFGRPTPPFSTQDPINPASLSAFFAENSGGRFTITRAALIGPIERGRFYDTDPGPETRLRDILEAAEALAPDAFFGADADADNQVEFEELLVVTVENFLHGYPGQPGQRAVLHLPATARWRHPDQDVQVHVRELLAHTVLPVRARALAFAGHRGHVQQRRRQLRADADERVQLRERRPGAGAPRRVAQDGARLVHSPDPAPGSARR